MDEKLITASQEIKHIYCEPLPECS